MLPAWMTGQIATAHQRYLDLLLSNRELARREAGMPEHSCLKAWLVPDAGGVVLELGCGPGKYVPLLVALGYEVVAVDPLEFPSWPRLRQLCGVTMRSEIYAENMPFPDEAFDHALCLGTLLYVNDPDAALLEVRRVLKPKGKLVLRTVNRSNLYTKRTGKKLDPVSKHLFEMDELIALLTKHDFRCEKSFSYGFMSPFLTNFWWYLISVWLPMKMQRRLSQLLPPALRHNNTVFASKS